MKTLKNCRVVDVRDGSLRECDVVLAGDTIERLEADAGQQPDSVDLEGAYLLPGLINCHTHLSIVFPFCESNEHESPAVTALRCYRRGKDAIEAGITTVRTVSDLHRADIALRTMQRAGWVDGPLIFSAGRGISVTGGHGAGYGAMAADGADEFLKRAREDLEAGADHLKIFITGGIAHEAEGFDDAQMTRAEMEAVVAAARSADTYVVAHAGSSRPISQALEAGVTCFEHGYLLDRRTAWDMHEAGAYLVPTLCVTRSEAWMRDNRFEEWTIRKSLDAGSDHMQSIRTAVEQGLNLLVGTDIPPGDTDRGVNVTVREMEHLVAAGLSPQQAIRAATLSAAELLGAAGSIGTVEPGRRADLVAVRRNPLEDIQALRDVVFVMQAGRVIRTAGL